MLPESTPALSLTSLPHVQLCYLPEPPAFLRKVPFILAAPVKILHQVASILRTLLFTLSSPPEFIMVQVGPLDVVQCKELINIPRILRVFLPSLLFG